MNTQPFASELSARVLAKRLAERDGDAVPKVTAPAERPSRFDAIPVLAYVGTSTEQPTGRSK